MDLKKFIGVFVVISFAKGMMPGEKTWTYELKSISSTSSDPDKLDVNLTVERVSRGVYAISGDVVINYDFSENEENLIGAQAFRSSTGSEDDYKVLPFQIPKMTWLKALNTHYKDILMDSLKDCSNAPVFEDKYEPPIEKKTYSLTKCQFTQDGLPSHLQEGFYKIILFGVGDIEFQIMVIAEVISTM